MEREKKETEWREPPFLSPVSCRFIFVFALSQFSGPDYLGAWNRLVAAQISQLCLGQCYLLTSRENDAYVHCLCAVLIRARFLKRWLILIFFSKNMQLEITKNC